MDKKAFTLTEVLISFVVASILVITIGTISHISTIEYNKTAKQAQLFNDVSFGFKLIRNRVRTSPVAPVIDQLTGHWKGDHLVIGDAAFGFYKDGSNPRQLVYADDWTDDTSHTVILTDEENKVRLDLIKSATDDFYTVALSGEKDKVQLTGLQADIMRRVQ